jgi:histidinol dehydrogenase
VKIERLTEIGAARRSIEQGTAEQQKTVIEIIDNVKAAGDQALYELTEKYDNVKLSSLKVTEEEIANAYDKIDAQLLNTIREAADNIRVYHEQQKRQSWFITNDDGSILGQKVTPLDAVGVYVPGGTAAYPSSVLMGVVPAAVAGVGRVTLVSPPLPNGSLPPGVLVAARESGVQDIYKIGGAQAIAALAYGTETIQPVDKIVGPGNIYVALAKRQVFGVVGIDMIAGPSEIVVLADETGDASFIAADLLSQAEHDPRSSAVLVTTSLALAEETAVEVERQLTELPRREIASASIKDHGMIYVVDTIGKAVEAVNELAPEHLEIMTADPMSLLGEIRHAGAIFLGPYSSEPVGDYFAGSNHVLPTSGTARFSNPLNIDDYVKKSSIISYSEKALENHGKKISAFARLEGLEAHARAIDIRMTKRL